MTIRVGSTTIRSMSFFERGPSYFRPRGWIWRLLVGTHKGWIGAGYKGGFTVYVARWSVGQGARVPAPMYTPVPWRAGITRNANAVPWLKG